MRKIFSGKRRILFLFLFFLFCGFQVIAGDEIPTTEPQEVPVKTEFADIVRDPEATDSLFIDIHYKGAWALFEGKSTKRKTEETPILTGIGAGRFPLPGELGERHYFTLRTDVGLQVIAENPLPLTGGHNFRDLGGIRAEAGKRVRWGLFFRGDSMDKLTEDDLAYLDTVPVLTLVDFRTEEEEKKAADKVPASVTENLHLRIAPGSLLSTDFKEAKTKEEYEAIMRDMYRGMIRDEAVLQQYKKFFRLVQNSEKLPILYHCSAGKDRTGLATALLLSALGVDRTFIMEDYLASNALLKKKYEKLLVKHPEMEPVFVVREEYLQDAFDEIEKSHESLEYFLRVVLDIDMGKLQKKALYRAEHL